MEKSKWKITPLLMLVVVCCASALGQSDANSTVSNSTIIYDGNTPVELARYKLDYSNVRIKAAQQGGQAGLAVIFEGTEGLHYYADDTSGKKLEIKAVADSLIFGQPIFPQPATITDPTGGKIKVYAGNFTIFVSLAATSDIPSVSDVNVTISGQACTNDICLMPFEKTITATIDWTAKDSMLQLPKTPAIVQQPATNGTGQTASFALAFLAGLLLNIMPCVWPVLPIIVMRIVTQAKHSKGRSVALGLAFCLGIMAFFAILAGANIILRVFYSTVLQWGDQFRNPAFVAAMSLLLVLLATSMFGAFTVAVPSAVSGKGKTGGGFSASFGMGLLAAVLSTPCSFGILAAAFAWAQSQPLPRASAAIMLIGAGMAAPYAVLTTMPGLLGRLPAPGRWMDLFKQAVGFVMLIIAVKLITALPQGRIGGILYFAVVLAFCAWMWGSWVDYNTKPAKKWLVRIMAAALALVAGWTFLAAPVENLIDWQDYDAKISDPNFEISNSPAPVLVKFTADWCLNCQFAERMVYSRRDIAELLKRKGVIAIKADTTEQDFAATKLLKDTYGEPGVPVTMLFIPNNPNPIRIRGILFGRELKSLLDAMPDKTLPDKALP